jgi:hypothetical protein
MPRKYTDDNWIVDDGEYGEDGERFPQAIQTRIENSYRKQGWIVPGEKPVEGERKPYGPGCGIGKGWLPVLVELDRVLALIDPEYQIHQIKEKFGGLRYYAFPTFSSGQHWDHEQKKMIIDDIDDFIRYEAFNAQITRAESRCNNMCEVCGSFAQVSGPKGKPQGGWQRCRCEDHQH